jgi:hypothetical protein
MIEPKAGQLWEIKEYIRIIKSLSFRYIFITNIKKYYKNQYTVYFDIIGPISQFERRADSVDVKWLIDNCELVSG